MTRRSVFFLLGAFAFFLACFFFSYPDVVFGNMSFAKRDVLRYYYPMWQYGVESWKAGSIPFWNPYHMFGKPFAANIQNCVFYPLQILLHLPDYTQAFNVYVLVHLAMAGAFTALWMRDWGCSKTASIASGIAFAYSGYMASAINLTISLCSAAYFPLALLCWRRALHEKGLGWRAGLAATLVIQYLAGDPSIVFSTLVVLATFTVFKTVERSLAERRFEWRVPARFAVSVGAFLGLAAFHYPLFYQFLKQSTRATLNYDWATMWSVQFNDLLGLFVPFFSDISIFFMDYWVRQSWLENYYAGIVVLVLAACAYRFRRDSASGYHVLLFLFGLSLALGRFSGVYWFFNKFFPFFGLIRYPVRFFYISYFALACLSGFMIDAVRKAPARRPAGRLWAEGTALAAALALVWAATIWSEPMAREFCVHVHKWLVSLEKGKWEITLVEDMALPLFVNLRRTAIFAGIAVAGLAVYRIGRVRGRALALFFAAALSCDLVLANVFEFQIDRRYMMRNGSHVEKVLEDPGLFRVFASPSLFGKQNMPLEKDVPAMQELLMQCFAPNLLMPPRLQDILGYDSLFLDDASYVVDARFLIKNPAETRYYNLLNAKYFVSPRPDLGAPFELVNRSEKTTLYRDPRFLPRAFLVRRAAVEPDRAKIVEKITAPDFDPRDVLYVDRDSGWTGPEGPEGEGSVTIESYAADRIEMRVDSPGPRWLFLSDAWYPAWRVTVDGRPAAVVKANGAFRAVRVGPGLQRVVWKYDPVLFKIGLAISLLTAAGLAMGACLPAGRGRMRGH